MRTLNKSRQSRTIVTDINTITTPQVVKEAPSSVMFHPSNVFYYQNLKPANIDNTYKGSSVFLIASGPSFSNVDSTKLNSPGILTWGMNNSVRSFRPNMWSCVDDPTHFIKSIWLDHKIQKFVPKQYYNDKIWDNDTWNKTNICTNQLPNVIYYNRTPNFNISTYLTENKVCWGDNDKLGIRSVFIATVKIMYILGFRRIYLLGVDFDMSKTKKYHFSQDRSDSSISNNNKAYKAINDRFTVLRKVFDDNGLNIYNCNESSKLTAFDYKSLDDAIGIESIKDTDTERTDGLYDRKANESKKK